MLLQAGGDPVLLLQVLVGALLGLVVMAAIITMLLRRSPTLFVANTLPDNIYAGPDDLDELVTGPEDEEITTREDSGRRPAETTRPEEMREIADAIDFDDDGGDGGDG